MRPSAWIDQSGDAQASTDLDANRLVLLDRSTDGQSDNGVGEPITEDIEF